MVGDMEVSTTVINAIFMGNHGEIETLGTRRVIASILPYTLTLNEDIFWKMGNRGKGDQLYGP